jgi:hypothetical protein
VKDSAAMGEWYPDDASLLTLTQDPATGVEYIPTGQSPYYLSFRRLLYRLLRATERANDFRVYQDGALSLGVRPGRAHLAGQAIDFAGQTGIGIGAEVTVHVWLDDQGLVQTGNSWPSDRTSFLPLATVTSDAEAVETVTDRRGEAYLQLPRLATLGVTAPPETVNQVLDGVSEDVTALALNFLCGGSDSGADSLHRHTHISQSVAGDAWFVLANSSSHSAANMALRLSLPELLPQDSELLVDTRNGFLQQRYDDEAYHLVGAVHRQFVHEGALTGSLNGKLAGTVPVSGQVADVVLSVGTNIESDDGSDGVSAAVKVNGVSVMSAEPSISASAGSGFRCTDQGDGTPATIVSNGDEQVARGDLLTVDLTRKVNGTVSVEPGDVVVLVVMKASRPA